MPPPGNVAVGCGTGYAGNEAPGDAGIATGRASWALLEALERSTAIWVVEVDLPGLSLRIATTGFDSNELGQYEPRVLSISGLNHQGPDRSGRMAARGPRVSFSDVSRAFARIESGPMAHRIQGSPARIKLAHPEVPAGSWWTEFAGEVAAWDRDDLNVSLALRTADRPMLSAAPASHWTLTAAEFPNIDGSAKGKYAPLLYGSHDSQVYTNRGLVPLLYVDTVMKWWLVSAGWTGVQRLYVNGVITAASNWEILHPLRKGRQYTLIHWIGGSPPGESDTLTADATGYEDQGDGTGAMLTNPAAQRVHFLTNFLFRQWKSGPYFGATALDPMIDPLLYEAARAWYDAHGYKGAFRVSAAADGYTFISNASPSSPAMKIFWTAAGQIGMKVEDAGERDLAGLPMLRRGEVLSIKYDDAGCTRSISAKYANSDADGGTLAAQEVTDPTASDEELQPETLEMTFSQVS